MKTRIEPRVRARSKTPNLVAMVGALLLAAGLLGAAPAEAARPVEETRAAAPDAKIEIESLSGQVRLVGWGRNEVRVTGTLGDDVEELAVRGDGGEIEIEVELPDGSSGRNKDYSVDLEISVPAGARVSLESVSTGTEVRDFGGGLELESVSGGLDLEGDAAGVDVETVSGNVRVVGAPGAVEVESVSGAVEIDGGSRRISAETVSGVIRVAATEIEACELGSVSGEIHFAGGLARGAELDVEGHSGVIDLRFEPDVSARFSVETFSGDIDNRLTGDTARRVSKYAPGKELEFTTGSGDAEVQVESFSGRVILRTR